jgi:hypothetical protein
MKILEVVPQVLSITWSAETRSHLRAILAQGFLNLNKAHILKYIDEGVGNSGNRVEYANVGLPRIAHYASG